MTTSQPSSRDISRRLMALIFGANFFGGLIIFLYFSVIDPLPVGGVAVRSLKTEDIATFGITGICSGFCDNQPARAANPELAAVN